MTEKHQLEEDVAEKMREIAKHFDKARRDKGYEMWVRAQIEKIRQFNAEQKQQTRDTHDEWRDMQDE